MFIFMITSGHWHSLLGRAPSALLWPGTYNAVKAALGPEMRQHIETA